MRHCLLDQFVYQFVVLEACPRPASRHGLYKFWRNCYITNDLIGPLLPLSAFLEGLITIMMVEKGRICCLNHLILCDHLLYKCLEEVLYPLPPPHQVL